MIGQVRIFFPARTYPARDEQNNTVITDVPDRIMLLINPRPNLPYSQASAKLFRLSTVGNASGLRTTSLCSLKLLIRTNESGSNAVRAKKISSKWAA